MGLDSDLSVMLPAARIPDTFFIPYELTIQGDIAPPSDGLPLHNRTTSPTRCTGSARVTLTHRHNLWAQIFLKTAQQYLCLKKRYRSRRLHIPP